MLTLDARLRPGQKHVVVVGAGFAGLHATKVLAREPRLYVTVLDQRNYHLFQPLLYQVATAALNGSDIAVPIRSQFARHPNVSVHWDRAQCVNLREKWIEGQASARASFDYLILACGSLHSYFGRPEWEEFAPGLKTVEQAGEIRRRILTAFEQAENEADPKEQVRLLTFVVVGGGPTGVELAGAIADVARTVLIHDFRRINPSRARVILLEAGPRVLPEFVESLSRHARRDLQALGVEVRTSARVTSIDSDGVQLGDERLPARTVLWAAGVEAEPLSRTLGVTLDHHGRVEVRGDLSVPGAPEVFVVGDMASVESNGHPVPGLAPAAMQMGRAAARNVIASLNRRPRERFRYHDKGIMATIGRSRAVVQTRRLRLTGGVAWTAWLFVHVFYLAGFRNRLGVMAEWAWSYLFSKRGARLITGRQWRLGTERATPDPEDVIPTPSRARPPPTAHQDRSA